MPPLKPLAKPLRLSKAAKCKSVLKTALLELREDDQIGRKNQAYSINKKMRDEKVMKSFVENQRRKLGSLLIKKAETEEKRPVFKSTKVVRQPVAKPVEMRPQMKTMKEEYKLREQSIDRFLTSADVLDEYKMLSHLGKGSFSVVALAVNRETNRRYAVKTYTKIDEID